MRLAKKVLAFVLCLAILLGSIMDYTIIGHAQSKENEVNEIEAEEVEGAEATEEAETVEKAEGAEEAETTETVEKAEAAEEVEEKEEIEKSSEGKEEKAPVVPEDAGTFTGEGFTVVQQVDSIWTDQNQKGYKANITVTNTGDNEIESWSLQCTLKDKIVNIWNAKLQEKDEKIIISADYGNINIAPQETVSFGYQAVCGIEDDPAVLENIELLGIRRETKESDYEVKTEVTSQWDNGNVIEVTIKNTGDHTIKGWELAFSFDGRITNLWNGTFSGDKENGYLVRCMEYNSWIEPGNSVSFGFQAEYEEAEHEGVVVVHKMTEVADGSIAGSQEPLPVPEDMDLDELRRWNRTVMNMDTSLVEEAVKKVNVPVRVAMLDSGVDYNESIPIAGRVNFVPGEEEMTELYEDATGHGTAVASVMVFHKEKEEEEEEEKSEHNDFAYEYYTEDFEDDLDWQEDDQYMDSKDEAEEFRREEETNTEDSLDTIKLGEYIESNQADFQGINPNMELYSVRILDDQNEAPVSRVIRGIEWARENNIKILNISFGTEYDDEKLHEVIREAYEDGMLIIAAAGNEGEIQYPAAYDEVIGVGSVDYNGEIKNACKKDSCVELTAPGEGVLAVGAFGTETEVAGTSFSAAEVSAVASILWQKDISVSNRFIRELLHAGANNNGKIMEGFGIVDCEHSLEIFDSLRETYQENNILDIGSAEIKENIKESAVGTAAEEGYVSANLGGVDHLNLISGSAVVTGEYLNVLKIGIRLQDGALCNLNDKKKFPAWHGYFKKEDDTACNYVAGYIYLSQLAKEINEGTVKDDGDIYSLENNEILTKELKESLGMEGVISVKGVNLGRDVLEKNKEIINYDKLTDDEKKPVWENILKSKLYDPQIKAAQIVTEGSVVMDPSGMTKSLIVYGMALHTLSDTFSHSSFGCCSKDGSEKWVWKELKKAVQTGTASSDWTLQEESKYNDNIRVRRMRYELAKQAVLNAMDHIEIRKEIDGTDRLYIAASDVKDFCSRNYVKETKQYKEMKEFSLYGKMYYIDPAYFEEAFALKNICRYMKECNGEEACRYMERIDVQSIKKRMKLYVAVDPVKLKGDSNRTDGASVIVSVYIYEGKKPRKKIVKARGMIGQKLCLALKRLPSNSKYRYVIKYKLFGESVSESISWDTPVIGASDTWDTVELLDTVQSQDSRKKCENIKITGKIVGLKESEGEVEAISGASIMLKQNGKQIGETFFSGQKGMYTLENCSPGACVMCVSHEGYKSFEQYLYIEGYNEIYYNATIKLIPLSSANGIGEVSGRIIDAVSGEGVEGVTLNFREGFNHYWGSNDIVTTVKTQKDGFYLAGSDNKLNAGYYCVEVLDDSKSSEKYDETYFNVVVLAGRIMEGQDAYISRNTAGSTMRIVLSWGECPSDLDAHVMMTFKNDLLHIYYGDRTGIVMDEQTNQEKTVVMLDRDDTSSYGPETVTVDLGQNDMEFDYYVVNFSHGTNRELSASDAVVQIYEDNFLIGTIHVPTEKKGYTWCVFSYDGENINIQNKIIE